jgi:hypothetical protein
MLEGLFTELFTPARGRGGEGEEPTGRLIYFGGSHAALNNIAHRACLQRGHVALFAVGALPLSASFFPQTQIHARGPFYGTFYTSEREGRGEGWGGGGIKPREKGA